MISQPFNHTPAMPVVALWVATTSAMRDAIEWSIGVIFILGKRLGTVSFPHLLSVVYGDFFSLIRLWFDTNCACATVPGLML